MIVTLQCYRCGAEYDYLGASPHPAQCQECGSRCVPPAGELTVTERSHWESANGLSKVWVAAVDERSRTFEFEVAAYGGRGKLVGLQVDGTSVNPQLDNTLETLPPAVLTALREMGVKHVDAGLPTQSS